MKNRGLLPEGTDTLIDYSTKSHVISQVMHCLRKWN